MLLIILLNLHGYHFKLTDQIKNGKRKESAKEDDQDEDFAKRSKTMSAYLLYILYLIPNCASNFIMVFFFCFKLTDQVKKGKGKESTKRKSKKKI